MRKEKALTVNVEVLGASCVFRYLSSPLPTNLAYFCSTVRLDYLEDEPCELQEASQTLNFLMSPFNL